LSGCRIETVYDSAIDSSCNQPTGDSKKLKKRKMSLLDMNRVENSVGGGSEREIQGRTEVRWRPGQETSLAPLYSNLRSFGSKCSVLKKVFATLLGLFGSSQ